MGISGWKPFLPVGFNADKDQILHWRYVYDYLNRQISTEMEDDSIFVPVDSSFYRYNTRIPFKCKNFFTDDSLHLLSITNYSYSKTNRIEEEYTNSPQDSLFEIKTYEYGKDGLIESETYYDAKTRDPKSRFEYKYSKYKIYAFY